MRVRVTTILDLVALNGDGKELPDPRPDTPEEADLLIVAREGVLTAVKQYEDVGFLGDCTTAVKVVNVGAGRVARRDGGQPLAAR